MRTYIIRKNPPGFTGRTITEEQHHPDGTQQPRDVLALPSDIGSEALADTLTALRRAYEAGREDRSAELIPDARPESRHQRVVRDRMLAAAADWGTGWTGLIDGGQYRINLHHSDEAASELIVSIGEVRYEELGRFRVRVLVEEISQ